MALGMPSGGFLKKAFGGMHKAVKKVGGTAAKAVGSAAKGNVKPKGLFGKKPQMRGA